METVLDLTNVYGYARLYNTLVQDGGFGQQDRRNLRQLLYSCYIANLNAVNKQAGTNLVPLEPEIFHYKMENNRQSAYRTLIQTIKALHLLEWNLGDDTGVALHQIGELKKDYEMQFYEKTGFFSTHGITSFSLCEDTLDPEQEPEQELNPNALAREHDTGPKFVYISAPLRGDVEKNIAFAKEKAREVFDEGNIPICPHLMFPPIADPQNPADDKKVMEMCISLLERCNEVRLYGPIWSEGMWAELRHAERLKIPVKTDRKEVPRTKQHKNQLCRS